MIEKHGKSSLHNFVKVQSCFITKFIVMMLGWLKTVKYDTWSWKVSDLKVAKLRVGTSKLGWRKLGRMRTRQTMEESHTILN